MQAETQSLALERTKRRQRAEHLSSALMADWGGEHSPCNDGHFAEARYRLPPQVRPPPAVAAASGE